MSFMSSFFRYDTPGRGISEEEAKERNYFKILGRKLTLIIKANLLFCGVNIILIIALLFPVLLLFVNTANGASDEAIHYYANILSGKQLMSPLPFLILALFAPTFAGLTFLCRNFSRQEHVFLVSDFFEHTKKNWKQSVLAGLMLSALLYIYMTAFFYYWNTQWFILRVLITFLGIVLLYMSLYIFPQIVTFRLSLVNIFKNAMIFSVGNFPLNSLAVIPLAALHIFLIWRAPGIWLILMAFFLVAFSTYTVNFVTWTAINKYMIKEDEASGAAAEERNKIDPVMTDDVSGTEDSAQ